MMPSSRSQSGVPTACKLSALLADMVTVEAVCERDIHGLSLDSRSTRPGDLFLACRGTLAHGQEFIDAAIKAGAVAVAYELNTDATDAAQAGNADIRARLPVPLFGIANLSQQMGLIADRFYRHPSGELQVIGVTGTNGKTSISHFLAQALSAGPNTPRCGIIGTLGNGLYGNVAMGSHTTPDALTLHALLDGMRNQGALSVVMEASSHGLEQGRVNHVAFDTAIFTNLSRDHLDYHLTMAAYAAAKRRLFQMPGLKKAVINADDAFGRELLSVLPATVRALAYGFAPLHPELRNRAGVWGSNVQLSMNGFEMDVSSPWGEGRLCSPLLGRFNAANLLAVLGVLLLNGIPLAEALRRAAEINTIPGRMERFSAPGKPLVVVDYAHTPDALAQVLSTLREHLTRGARLWCVFGCGGERDRGKRPLMGAMAEEFADYVVITDDNPRHEDPLGIITDILAGLANPDGVYIQRLRAQAIAFAITYARPGDIVLIAGKGHESHQYIGAQKFPFSDRQHAIDLLNKAAQ
ncbi:MAG: UDP-N-acetylmuramoyl-L-alanyl-D-glutamate--2,6-diaminopimelate ligase [Gammaproteobacteria bacterium]